ncbi:putative oxidoreductase [Gordonia effusa NBRC 100432]|uniref:Putative oxidoreductase n=1 Tax=Gordonia effusa NBRC 100432 TaxID=1077974 RepID=H0R0F4_9ACTN|nr:5,6-dimethylbenzimidazole synthase [Gordonia effusa]GAB18555.1 putative oxidoreductase [Gordonia effusa NBRC 100432]
MTVYDAIRTRRDVRAEYSGEVIDDEVLARILAAAHQAPSVGNTQPWDFVVVQDPKRLDEFAAHVASKRREFADTLPPERAKTFDPIAIEGVRESGTGIVVTYDHSRGGTHVLGRASIPETGVFSAALAIQNLWLAATAEGIGVGWVSFYDRDVLADFIAVPDGVVPIAWLCVGPVERLQTVPDLVRYGWRSGRPLRDAIHRDVYGGGA